MTSQEFKERVRLWAKKLKVDEKLREIHIRNMKNKLASCSSKGRITFDSTVLEMESADMDRIIVHELLHLR
ncbi:MAG: M48 family metallopeptidase, partial [Aquificaceae bacterium]